MYRHPSHLRIANVRRTFRLLLARGPVSRAEVARASGLSGVTAGKVADEMIEAGLLEEIDAPPSSVPAMGRPPRLLSLSRTLRLPIVELGVRECVVRSITLADAASPADVARGPIERFAMPRTPHAFFGELTKARRRLPRGASPAVLMSVPGVLSAASDEVLFSPNLQWTHGREVLERIGRTFDAPSCAVQEISALALGELAHNEGSDSFLLVDFGDGVGGAVVLADRLLQGPQPLCGEIGHTGLVGNRRRCGCGAVGCLETLVSRGGLLASFRTRRRAPKATWDDCVEHVAARGIEPWLATSIDAAATVIAGALNLIGVSELVVTGDLPALHPDVTALLDERVQAHALIGRFGRLVCRTAPRRRVFGLVTAAADRVLLAEPAAPSLRAS
ncbi:MAG: ROK family protein [Phycisphaerae bacterium]|nr:ROK family protein [Phycisphaerae bacterium]